MNGYRSTDLGHREFFGVWAEMQRFTEDREEGHPDEIWFVEHPPVFTLGLNADAAHVLSAGEIPVIQTDRGGEVTYHGPGQQVVYVMLDLKRLGMSIRALVEALEGSIIDTVSLYGVEAYGRRDAPGVYVDGMKLAAVGLRVRRGCTYHGIAVNIDMDLEPYARIHPCGMSELRVTQLADLCGLHDMERFRRDFEPRLVERLGL